MPSDPKDPNQMNDIKPINRPALKQVQKILAQLKGILDKKYQIILWSIFVAFFIFLTLYGWHLHKKEKEMRLNPSLAKGKISGIFTAAKMGPRIIYDFKVKDQVYIGDSRRKQNDYFNIGDSCWIIYDSCDITINELYRDKFHNLSFVNKKGSIKEDWDIYLDSLLRKD